MPRYGTEIKTKPKARPLAASSPQPTPDVRDRLRASRIKRDPRAKQEYLRQAMTKPVGDEIEERQVLSNRERQALTDARTRLRSHIHDLYGPQLKKPSRPITPNTEREMNAAFERGIAQTGIFETAEDSTHRGIARRALEFGVESPALREYVSGQRPFDRYVALEIGLLPTWIVGPFRGVRGAAAGAKALTKGAGAAGAREAATGAYRAPGWVSRGAGKIRTRTFKVGEKAVSVPAAGSRTGRALERIADKVRPVGAKTGLQKSVAAKAGREYGYRLENVDLKVRNNYATALKKLGRKLDDVQEYTLRVLAEGVDPQTRAASHRAWAQQTKREDSVVYHDIHAALSEKTAKYVVQTPDGLVLAPTAPRELYQAWELFQSAGELREDLLADLGRLVDDQIASRIHSPGRVYHGAKYKTYENTIQEALEASPVRAQVFAEIDKAFPNPTQAQAQKTLWDAQIRSHAARIYDDPQAIEKVLALLRPEMDDATRQMLDVATVEMAWSDQPLRATAEKYGLDPDQLERHAAEHGERLTGRILSNAEVWKTKFANEMARFALDKGLKPSDERMVAKWAGAVKTDTGYEWTPEATEKFVKGIEEFIRRGQGPSPVKLAFRSLAPAFREALEHADLPDVPPHVAQVFKRIFEFDRPRGGRIVGADDVVVGVAYAPVWRGMPIKLSAPQQAMGAYIRRALALFGGGRGRAIGAGPDDVHLRKAYTGALALSGFFKRDVIGPKVESAMIANRMSVAHMARADLVKAGTDIPSSVTDVAVKIDPKIDAPDELKVVWDKMKQAEDTGRKLGAKDIQDVSLDVTEAMLKSTFPERLEGKAVAEVAAEIMEAQTPIENIKWVSSDFLDRSGLLYVPAARDAHRAGLTKMLKAGGLLTVDALNDFQKAMILWLNPAYAVMQFIGNSGMNLMQQGAFMPTNIWRSVLIGHELDWIDRVLMDDLMGTGTVTALTGRTTPGKLIQGTLGHWENLLADFIPRRTAFLHEARKAGYGKGKLAPLFKAARDGDEEALAHLDYITRKAKRAIVDFDRMSPFERNVLSRYIFFYPWLRGASEYSVTFIADHPVQAMAIALAYDHMRAAQDEELGGRPAYAQLDVPLSTSAVGLGPVGLEDLVGKHAWKDEAGNPMVFKLRQALTITTPYELAGEAIAFAGAGDRDAAAGVVQHLTPFLYGAGVALYGYDPFQKREVDPGLATFFGQFGPQEAPLGDRWTKINMSEEERAKANEKAMYPRQRRHEWWRLLGGSLAPTPYAKAIANRRALKNRPMQERKSEELRLDSQEAGMGVPPETVLEDLKWKVDLDRQLRNGMKPSERLEIVAKLYGERFGFDLSNVASQARSEGDAQKAYLQLRGLLFPRFASWNKQVEQRLKQMEESEVASR